MKKIVITHLKQLTPNNLTGVEHLCIHAELTDFPLQILEYADSLKILDLNHNQLDSLPEQIQQLTNLRRLFCSNNKLTTLPANLGKLKQLTMLALKHNCITSIPEHALPRSCQWLILTDNQLQTLPNSITDLIQLKKLALSGNLLTKLPEKFELCAKLEFLRLAANKFSQFPDIVAKLKHLAWFSFAGNPFCQRPAAAYQSKQTDFSQLSMGKLLGEGASGKIYQAQWQQADKAVQQQVAVKVFKAGVGSDGYCQDEFDAVMAVKAHPNLIGYLGQVQQKNQLALIMPLIDDSYQPLGLVPSLQSITRDCFKQQQQYTQIEIDHFIQQMQEVLEHLHQQGVSHGDFYAHNMLINKHGHLILGDFGASSYFAYLAKSQQQAIINIEKRALYFFQLDLQSLLK